MQSIKLEISFDDKRELDAAWAGILRDISYLPFLPLSLAECISRRVFSLEGSGSCWSSVCMSGEVAILCRAVMPPSPLRDRLEEAIAEEILGECSSRCNSAHDCTSVIGEGCGIYRGFPQRSEVD